MSKQSLVLNFLKSNMGKIPLVLLCVGITLIAVVCGDESKECDQSTCQLEFGSRLRELEKSHREFKTLLLEATAGFARLRKCLSDNGAIGASCKSEMESATTTAETPTTTTTTTTTEIPTTKTTTRTIPTTTTNPIPPQKCHVRQVHTDQTLEEEGKGVDVVNAVIDKIHGSGIFPDDNGFLHRLAFAESRFGEHPQTYRSNSSGGIWQTTRENFEKTRATLEGQLQNFQDQIQKNFNINWQNTSWTDLCRPLYSGLATRLLLSSFSQPIPQVLTRQAEFRSKWSLISPIGSSAEEFKSQIKQLEANQTCTGKMDLLVILDESGSVGERHFQKSLEFVGNLFKSYSNATRGNVRLGFVTYSDEIRSHFRIVNSLNMGDIYLKVKSASYAEGGTNTNEAIADGIVQFRNGNYGYQEREGVPKIMALFTGGQSQDGVNNSAKATARGITTFAVGIGSSLNPEELKEIAGNDQLHAFSLEDFDALAEFFGRMNSATCAVSQNPKTGTNAVDQLGQGEKRIYCYALPSDGITLTLTSSMGNVTGYFSYSYETPSLALNDGVLNQPKTYIPPRTLGVPLYFKKEAAHEQQSRRCDVYVTIQGVGDPRNIYTVTAENGYAIGNNTAQNGSNNNSIQAEREDYDYAYDSD